MQSRNPPIKIKSPDALSKIDTIIIKKKENSPVWEYTITIDTGKVHRKKTVQTGIQKEQTNQAEKLAGHHQLLSYIQLWAGVGGPVST